MKKTLSILLALVMVIGSFPAFADEAKAEKKEMTPQLKTLVEYGAVKGVPRDNGETDYLESEVLSRPNAIILLCRLLGVEDQAKATVVTEKPFSDVEVNKYYAPYIQYAKDNGITNGKGETFGVEDSVTVKQFLAFQLRALGYPTTKEAYEKTMETAKELKLTTKLNLKEEDAIVRNDAYNIMFNTLQTPKKDGEKALKYVLGYVKTDFEAKVVANNKVELTFSSEVDLKKEDIKIMKGNFDTKIYDITTSKDKKVVTVKTAKLQAGDYDITVSLGEDNKLKSSFSVEKNDKLTIKILGEKALTHKAKKLVNGQQTDVTGAQAYVYYDVIDQYGNSVRSTTSIQWTGSAKKIRDEKNIGRLTFERSDDKAFTYGEQLYVTGVHVKDGATVSAALTIGQEQSANTVEILGFVKKGTTNLLKTLPKGFLSGTYYLVYDMNDQQGNYLEPEIKPVADGQLTFVIKDGIMVIEKLDKEDESIQVIDGVAHNGIMVKPGLKVDDGGKVVISAIANKTGANTEWETSVDDVAILNAFVLGSPALIADGDKDIKIPFTATDKDGNEITDFVTIAKNEIFNMIQITCSEGNLELREENDGTAGLYFTDQTMNWDADGVTDGQDRSISMTAVVVGGDASNQLVYIQDKRRPEQIVYKKEGYVDRYIIENASQTLALDSFDYIDQYGYKMDDLKDDGIIDSYDNGFFAAHQGATFSDTDYNGYTFGVKAKANSMENFTISNDFITVVKDSSDDAKKLTITAKDDQTETVIDKGSIEFQIHKTKNATDSQDIGKKRIDKVAILDIAKVTNITFDDAPKKIRIVTDFTEKENGKDATLTNPVGNDGAAMLETHGNITIGDADVKLYAKKFELIGKYNGHDVTIPEANYSIKSDYFKDNGDNKILDQFTGELKYSDIYNGNTARNLRKDFKFDVTATITRGAGNDNTTEKISVLVSDAKPEAADIVVKKEWTSSPDLTKKTYTWTTMAKDEKDVDDLGDNEFTVLDQYDVVYKPAGVTGDFEVSNFKPVENEFAANNFSKVNSGAGTLALEGVERGDKFDLKIIIGDVSKLVKVTAGADKKAKVVSGPAKNVYVKQLRPVLEAQRVNGL